MSELLWIAVPGGLTRPFQGLIRVMLVVPRLVEGFLRDFGLEDWPAILGRTPRSSCAPRLAHAANSDGTAQRYCSGVSRSSTTA